MRSREDIESDAKTVNQNLTAAGLTIELLLDIRDSLKKETPKPKTKTTKEK